jgi:hypothetical protein
MVIRHAKVAGTGKSGLKEKLQGSKAMSITITATGSTG